MDLKSLEKASKIIAKVKQIDKEIIELDKFAAALVNGDVRAEFSLSFTDNKPKEEKPKEPESDFHHGGFSGLILNWCNGEPSKPTRHKHTITSDTTESVTLNLLAVLLADKYDKRTALLNQIKKLGIQI